MNGYGIGNLVRVSVLFTDSLGRAVDPAVVRCQIYTPAAVTTTYTYGTDAVVKDATGSYHYDVDANAEGEWRFRWYGTGSNQAAAESGFVVYPSLFA